MSNDPLHGITLKEIVTKLVDKYGWQELGQRITIKCFTNDPSISSSLKFLRKTPWARSKVETLYIETNWALSSSNKNSSNKNIWSVERSGHDS
jgi:uncharacterized protein (DUF2132 family)